MKYFTAKKNVFLHPVVEMAGTQRNGVSRPGPYFKGSYGFIPLPEMLEFFSHCKILSTTCEC